MSRPPRVTLGTNLVLSALVIANGRFATLRHAWQGGRCVPLVSKATTAELIDEIDGSPYGQNIQLGILRRTDLWFAAVAAQATS